MPLPRISRQPIKERHAGQAAEHRKTPKRKLRKSQESHREPFDRKKAQRAHLAVVERESEVAPTAIEQVRRKHRLVAPHRVVLKHSREPQDDGEGKKAPDPARQLPLECTSVLGHPSEVFHRVHDSLRTRQS